jgi:hypothetical protein
VLARRAGRSSWRAASAGQSRRSCACLQQLAGWSIRQALSGSAVAHRRPVPAEAAATGKPLCHHCHSVRSETNALCHVAGGRCRVAALTRSHDSHSVNPSRSWPSGRRRAIPLPFTAVPHAARAAPRTMNTPSFGSPLPSKEGGQGVRFSPVRHFPIRECPVYVWRFVSRETAPRRAICGHPIRTSEFRPVERRWQPIRRGHLRRAVGRRSRPRRSRAELRGPGMRGWRLASARMVRRSGRSRLPDRIQARRSRIRAAQLALPGARAAG